MSFDAYLNHLRNGMMYLNANDAQNGRIGFQVSLKCLLPALETQEKGRILRPLRFLDQPVLHVQSILENPPKVGKLYLQ